MRRALRIPLGRRARLEAELDEEIGFHVEMRIEQLVRRGMSPEAAREEALRRFGAIDDVRPRLIAALHHREGRLSMLAHLDALADDLRYALRQLRRAPGFALGVILTFALGIGANAALFGILDRLLLRPPAHVREPDRVYGLQLVKHFGASESRQDVTSYPMFADVRDHARGFDGVAASTFPNGYGIGRGPDAWRASGAEVTGEYFGVLGVRPALGRFFGRAEDRLAGGSPVAVISHGLWQRRFGGDSSVLGRALDIGTTRFAIIGVAPEGFAGPWKEPTELWLPLATTEALKYGATDWARQRGSYWIRIVGRVGTGIAPAAAEAQATAAARAGDAASELPDPKLRVVLESVLPTRASRWSTDARISTLLAAVSAMVLLIACANIANLLLARALGRRREIAVRLALGVSRLRLVRQLVLESLVLAMAGGAAALVVARWGATAIRATMLERLDLGDALVDGRVLAFTAAVALLTGVLTGLVPALEASRPELTDTLKAGTRGGGIQGRRLRTALLLAQAALSVVLVAGAGLFVRSLRNVEAIDLGMDTRHVVAARAELKEARFDSARAEQAVAAMVGRARRTPGVRHVGVGAVLPLSGAWAVQFSVPGLDSLPTVPDGGPYVNAVSAGFFDAVGTRIVRGRGFTEHDERMRARVAVVNENMARRFWPGRDAIGQCIKVGDASVPCSEIVGISQNAHRQGIVEGEVLHYFVPLAWSPSGMTDRIVFARVTGDAVREAAVLRRALQTAVPGMPYVDARAMHTLLAWEMLPWRLGATVLGAFGALALALAALGLYSIITYGVTQRVHELGVRMALGARAGDIVRLVLGQGVRIVLVGMAAGVAASLVLAPLARSLLFGVSPRDPVVIAAATATLLVVAVLASLVPAVRASRTDPVRSLRSE